MAITLTSTAYSAPIRSIENGVFSVSFDYTTPAGTTLSASANATCILGPRIQNGLTILSVIGSHTSGAATMPVDIGVDSAVSALASQKAAGTNAIAALSGSVPYKVSTSDDAANLWRTVKFFATPGTDTEVANFKYTILLTRDS